MRHMGVYLSLLWVSGTFRNCTQSEVKEMKCIMGEGVTFPAAVKNTGFLIRTTSNDGTPIAEVINEAFSITSNSFTGRVQWDSSTGLFSITGLKMEDSGQYKVQNNDGQNTDAVYQLTMYDPVSTPQVSSRNKMKPTCSVLCSVENGREVTLSWQREGETLNSTSSPDLNTPLSLPLEIEENSAPFSCVAANPASNKTVTVKPEEFCLDSVSKPHITSTAAEGYQGRCCSVLCSVENGREVTLSWQREGETLSNTRSPDLNTTLSLLLEIEENSAPYTCVAANPVNEERTVLNTSELCRVDCSDYKGAVIYLKKRSQTLGTEDPPDEITYADINHRARGTQRGNEQKEQTTPMGASDDTVYSNVNHKRPKKQEAAAPTVTQGESSCVYAEVRRK
ncbi:hypothetical protein AGOR_G00194840 [Albula goreensis]|uniref:Ig-like domain-containing protein n=1 Tax=Albula goreensis TaxID=1534307 RepID=A0A8T3CRG9_9TELE|nr:hypothetical protein AGOR_G00194840 [Albula goreensis]